MQVTEAFKLLPTIQIIYLPMRIGKEFYNSFLISE